MRVAVFSTRPYDREGLDAANERAGASIDFVYHDARLSPESASLAKGCEGVCLFPNDDAGANALEALSGVGVRLIALRSAGFNNVDLEAADRCGLTVCRVPSYSPEAVAEHAMALLLTLNRKTHRAYNRVREHNFELAGLRGFDLHGKTVGVVGTGKIGLAFCRIARGFGCRVLAHDPYPSDDAEAIGIEYTGLDALCAESRVVSLHAPLTPETRHLINADRLEQLGSDAILINTSRGGLVDTDALIVALKARRLAGVALDVYEEEEHVFFKDLSAEVLDDDRLARLISFPNVLVTGHQGFFTQEALDAIAETTVGNIAAFASGELTEANTVRAGR
jgi:D-lactate dehydrogenase